MMTVVVMASMPPIEMKVGVVMAVPRNGKQGKGMERVRGSGKEGREEGGRKYSLAHCKQSNQ
jgi:hypothetical protein